MGLSILNNIPSLEAQNQLAVTNTNLQNTLFQLSSGSKINSGADDPAGLSIADGLQANISALTQSAQNVTDGVGMLQTADGALSQVTTLLNRAVTLATEAGNAGLTQDQQNALQNEFASITAEINQIGSNTTYNNTPVFSGSQMSVFLSDGSGADAMDPNISVNMPTLSSSSLGLATYATGTLDLTANPTSGNTVQIGAQVYTFVASGQANAAGDVAIGNTVQDTLQHLQEAVNGGGGAGSDYGSGTAVNNQATITSVNGGSAVVQALTAGTAGNNVVLTTSLSSNVGSGGGTTLSGGAAAVSDAGTLTLTGQPTLLTAATGSISMTAMPDTLASATGVLNLAPGGTANLPAAFTNAQGTLDLSVLGEPTAGDKITIGGSTYTFVANGAAASGNNTISLSGSVATDLQELQNAVNGTGTLGASTYETVSGTATANGQARITATPGNNTATVTSLVAGVGAGDAGNTTIFSATGTIASKVNGGGYLGGTTLGANGDTITVGSQTYTFVNSGFALQAGDVVVGAVNGGQSAQNVTLQNLMNAVNGSGVSGTTTFGFGTQAAGSATMFVANNTTASEATFTATTGGVGNGLSTTAGTGNTTPFTATGTLITNGDIGPNGTLAGGAPGDTVTIGGSTYTFVAANQALNAYQVAVVNGNINSTLTNLMNAVDHTGTAGNGTYGVGTAVNGSAMITGVNNGVATVEASTGNGQTPAPGAGTGPVGPGGTGNFVQLSATSPVGAVSASGASLSGGTAADTITIGAVTYTFVAADQATSGNEVAVGSNPQGTLDNLKAAVNSTSVSSGNVATYHLAGASSLQGASGATITSDSLGVAHIQANTAGQQANADIALSAFFQGGDTTGVLGGLTNPFLGGGTGTGGGGSTFATGTIDLLGSQPVTGNATGTLSFTNQVAAGDTVTVGTQTYRFETLGNIAQANDVVIGSDLKATLQNLEGAINGTGTPGTSITPGVTEYNATAPGGTAVASGFTYSGTGANETGTMNISSSAAGVAGDGVSLSYLNSGTGTNSASGNLANGGTGDTVTIGGTQYTFVAANAATSGNEIALGSTVQATLTNLANAVNAGNASTTAATFSVINAGLQGANGATIATNGINGSQMTVTAKQIGSVGNNVALSSTLTVGEAGSPGGGAGAQAASATLSLSGNPTAGNTVTIGNETYTFTSTVPTAANQVMLGDTATATLTHLKEAVNNGLGGLGVGSDYGAGTAANGSATVTSVNGNQAVITAIGLGTAGNSINFNANITSGAGGGAVGTVNSKLNGGGSSVDLSSTSDAETALTTIAAAIATVAAQRGAIGSGINQMNAAVNVMTNTSQNLTSSLSGIQDANIGQVVANMSKYQVLEQTGIAALAQANSQKQAVLKLLG